MNHPVFYNGQGVSQVKTKTERILVIAIADILLNTIDALQIYLAFFKVNLLKDMNKFYDDSDSDTSSSYSFFLKANILLIIGLTLNILIIYSCVKFRSQKRISLIQVGLLEVKMLLKLEISQSSIKENICISDLIISAMVVSLISESAQSWKVKIALYHFNAVYLLARIQSQFNAFNFAKSILLLIFPLYYFLRRNQLSLDTISKQQFSFMCPQQFYKMKERDEEQNLKDNQNSLPLPEEEKKSNSQFFGRIEGDDHSIQSQYKEVSIQNSFSSIHNNRNQTILKKKKKMDQKQQTQLSWPKNALKLTPKQTEDTTPTIGSLKKKLSCILPSLTQINENDDGCENLSLEILNQLDKGIILMNLNQRIVFHNQKILHIFNVHSSSKIIQKLFSLKKERKDKEGDLLDSPVSKGSANGIFFSNQSQFGLPKTQKSNMAPAVGFNQNKRMKSGQEIQMEQQQQTLSDKKKKNFQNNKSQSTCEFLMLPPTVIFKSRPSKAYEKKKEGEIFSDEEQKNEENEEEEKDCQEKKKSKFEDKRQKQKSVEINKINCQQNEPKFVKNNQTLYSTDEKSFEVIIQEIISLIQLYRHQISLYSSKSENNLDQSSRWHAHCEKTIKQLQNQGYTFNAVLDNCSSLNTPRDDVIESPFTKILETESTRQRNCSFFSEMPPVKLQYQSSEQKDFSESRIIRIQIKLWKEKNSDELKQDFNFNTKKKTNEISLKKQAHTLANQRKKKIISQMKDQMSIPLLFIMFKDITKEVEKEEQDRMNRFKLKILSSISHELRTPLNCSMVMLQMLLQSNLIDQSIKSDYIEPAFYNNQILYFIINDILDYAQIQSNSFQLKYSTFNLQQTLQDCLNLFLYSADFKGINLSLNVDPSVPQVISSDQERIKQVLINLLSNAIKYTTHGSIIVNAITSQLESELIIISVQDTGCGIPPHLHKDIFEYMDNPNQKKGQLNSNGAGLGLTISQKIVRGLSGNKGIDLESQEGVGSKFSFFIKNKEQIQKGQVQSKRSQFNNIMLNWKSLSYSSFQSQEIKSEASSIKGHKQPLTPVHSVNSPNSRSFSNFLSKEEERKMLLQRYVKLSSHLRKSSKFQEEQYSRVQSGLSNSFDPQQFPSQLTPSCHPQEVYQQLNSTNFERRMSRNNYQLLITKQEKSVSSEQNSSNNGNIENDTETIDQIKEIKLNDHNSSLKNCDVFDSLSDLTETRKTIPTFLPFQGRSLVITEDKGENELNNNYIQKEQSSNLNEEQNQKNFISKCTNRNTIKSISQISVMTNNNNTSDGFNDNQTKIITSNFTTFNSNGVLSVVKENIDESEPDTYLQITSERFIKKTNQQFKGINNLFQSVSIKYTDEHPQSFNELEGIKQVDLNHKKENSISHFDYKPNRFSQEMPEDSFYNLIQNRSQENTQTQDCAYIPQNIDEIDNSISLTCTQQSQEEKSIQNKRKVKLEHPQSVKLIKIPNPTCNVVKSARIIQTNENDCIGMNGVGEIDTLIMNHSKDQLIQNQNEFKKKLQVYFQNRKCKCTLVLVVDDNQFNVLVMKKLLESYAVVSDQAFNGKNALDKVTERSQTGNNCCPHYKLILMDIDMPVMNGYEATQAILQFYKDKFKQIPAPIISACTAFVSKENKIQAEKRGMKFFLGKPLEVFHLDFVLEYCLLKRKK